MTNRSKSTLFLIEQLIVIAVFAVCAVACISILTASYFYANDGNAINNATIKAQSGAEVFKASGSNFSTMAEILGGTVTSTGLGADGVSVVAVYYDKDWVICTEDDAGYVLNLEIAEAHNNGDFDVITGRVRVRRITGEELITLSVAARNN